MGQYLGKKHMGASWKGGAQGGGVRKAGFVWWVREVLPFDLPTRTQRQPPLHLQNGVGRLRMTALSPPQQDLLGDTRLGGGKEHSYALSTHVHRHNCLTKLTTIPTHTDPQLA